MACHNTLLPFYLISVFLIHFYRRWRRRRRRKWQRHSRKPIHKHFNWIRRCTVWLKGLICQALNSSQVAFKSRHKIDNKTHFDVARWFEFQQELAFDWCKSCENYAKYRMLWSLKWLLSKLQHELSLIILLFGIVRWDGSSTPAINLRQPHSSTSIRNWIKSSFFFESNDLFDVWIERDPFRLHAANRPIGLKMQFSATSTQRKPFAVLHHDIWSGRPIRLFDKSTKRLCDINSNS